MLEISIDKGLRPCHVDGKKALFHKWEQFAQPVEMSPLVGGHPGGQISCVMGIIELEDGKVTRVSPEVIRFVPGIFNKYDFDMLED